MNARVLQSFPPAAQAVGNTGAALNANGQMHHMPLGGGGGIGGNIFQGLGVIYPLPAAASHSLGGVASPNAAYSAWAAQQAMLGQQWVAGGRAGDVNGLGGQVVNAKFGGANGVHFSAVGYNPARQAGLGGFMDQPPHAGGIGGGIPVVGGGTGGANGLGGPATKHRIFLRK